MKTEKLISLQAINSFSVDCIAPTVFFPSSLVELEEVAQTVTEPFYVLGEGYNTLFVDEETPTVIRPSFYGIDIREDDENFFVSAGASENWHDLVSYCIKKGIYGLENLALIPGSLGAAPIQNIGAYGVELSDFCLHVDWFDLAKCKLIKITNAECEFEYRESVFKNRLKQKGIITAVTLKLPKKWVKKVTYAGLNTLPDNASAKDVMEQVIALRQAKLPDPSDLPNAGSFFKNPVVSKAHWQKIARDHPNMPYYLLDDGNIKLAAGWLIDQAGLKGYKYKGVGVHVNQALVLVNYSSKSGAILVELARYVREKVQEMFDVKLTPEVRIIGRNGERPIVREKDNG